MRLTCFARPKVYPDLPPKTVSSSSALKFSLVFNRLFGIFGTTVGIGTQKFEYLFLLFIHFWPIFSFFTPWKISENLYFSHIFMGCGKGNWNWLMNYYYEGCYFTAGKSLFKACEQNTRVMIWAETYSYKIFSEKILTTMSYFCKTLHLSCLTDFWIRLRWICQLMYLWFLYWYYWMHLAHWSRVILYFEVTKHVVQVHILSANFLSNLEKMTQKCRFI